MVRQYKEICKNYRCRAKVFTQMEGDMKDRLGKPDLMVLFTNTVSHKMIITATNEAKRNNTEIVRSHSSSGSALEGDPEPVLRLIHRLLSVCCYT